MKRTNIAYSVVITLTIALAALCFTSCKPKDSQQLAVKIALNLPITGHQAAYSGEYPIGFKMGIEEGCKSHGIDPAIFKLDIQDNQGLPKNTVSIFQNQKINGFDAYISGLSTSSVAIAPDLDKMPEVSNFFLAFETFITKDSANRFRVLPNYKLEGPKYPEYIKYRNAKRVFMLTMNIAPTEQEFSTFVDPELARMGVDFKREVFDLNTNDYRTLALKAIKFKPDLVIINGLSFNILPLIQSLKSLGFTKDGNVLCCMDFIDLLYAEKISAELEGTAFISPPFEIPGAVSGADEWRTRFIKYGGKVANYVQAHAYDTGRIFVDAYVKNKTLKPSSIQSVFPYSDGVCGKIALDSDRDLVSNLGFLKIGPGGKREIINL